MKKITLLPLLLFTFLINAQFGTQPAIPINSTAEVVADNIELQLICPPNQIVNPNVFNTYYFVPDYWANGDVITIGIQPVLITSQEPVAGTLLPVGEYIVTITAEDILGNISTCTFELVVSSDTIGIKENQLTDRSIVIHPNPAGNYVTISNSQNIELDRAYIYDITGRQIKTFSLQDMGIEKILDISELTTANYLILILGSDSQIVKHLIKE